MLDEVLQSNRDAFSVLQGAPTAPADVVLDGTAATGVGPAPALFDHVHNLPADAPVDLGSANAEGTSSSVARSDHVHKRSVSVKKGGSAVGSLAGLNFEDGAGISVTVAQDVPNDEVDVTVALTAAVPRWMKFTVGHAALQAAAMANDIQLYSLPAGGCIHGVKIKHSTLFAGVGITDYKISVGIVGNLTKYAPAFDVDTAVSGTAFQLSSIVGSEDHGAATSIRIAATSTGANLSLSTAGSVDVWLLVSVAV